MTSRTYDGYASSRKELGTWLVPVKVMLSVFGTILVCLLITLRVLPTFRISTILLFIASASFMLVKGRGRRICCTRFEYSGAVVLLSGSCGYAAHAHAVGLGIRDVELFHNRSTLFRGWLLARQAVCEKARGCAGSDVRGRDLSPNRKALALAALCLAIGTAVLAYEYHLIGEIPSFPLIRMLQE